MKKKSSKYFTCAGHCCGKIIKGAFKQDNGTYLCASCAYYTAIMESTVTFLEDIQDRLSEEIAPGKRPRKNNIRLIRNLVFALISIRKNRDGNNQRTDQ
jgi:hypothetical protein